MSPEDRRETAERIYVRALGLEDRGRRKQAIAHYYVAAGMGLDMAQCRLADLLSERSRTVAEEAVYWYLRAVRQGYAIAAWNLAMTYRWAGTEFLFWAWMRKAAIMGQEEAIELLAFFPDKRKGRLPAA